MPLYDITHDINGILVTEKMADVSGYIKALRLKLPATSFDRVVKTVDEAIGHLVQSGDNKLIWTKMGAMFGHKSMQPKARVDHLWEKVIQSVGDGTNCLKTVGTLLRWRLSARDENWLLYRRETGDIDVSTGKNIYVSEYWIKDDFVHIPKPKVKSSGFSVNDLKTKFNMATASVRL